MNYFCFFLLKHWNLSMNKNYGVQLLQSRFIDVVITAKLFMAWVRSLVERERGLDVGREVELSASIHELTIRNVNRFTIIHEIHKQNFFDRYLILSIMRIGTDMRSNVTRMMMRHRWMVMTSGWGGSNIGVQVCSSSWRCPVRGRGLKEPSGTRWRSDCSRTMDNGWEVQFCWSRMMVTSTSDHWWWWVHEQISRLVCSFVCSWIRGCWLRCLCQTLP